MTTSTDTRPAPSSVLARVTLDTAAGTVDLPAYVHPHDRWNGYVTPGLPTVAVALLAVAMGPGDARVILDGGVVTVTEPEYPDEPTTIHPTTEHDGTVVYVFDLGWAFTPVGDAPPVEGGQTGRSTSGQTSRSTP